MYTICMLYGINLSIKFTKFWYDMVIEAMDSEEITKYFRLKVHQMTRGVILGERFFGRHVFSCIFLLNEELKNRRILKITGDSIAFNALLLGHEGKVPRTFFEVSGLGGKWKIFREVFGS